MAKKEKIFVVSAWGISDVGLMRDHNEDYFVISDDLLLYAVADGMGGHAGGATASRMAIDILHQEIRKARTPLASLPPAPGRKEEEKPKEENSEFSEEEQCRTALLKGFATSNREVYIKGMSEPELAGMGTTLSAMIIHDDLALFGHVGDSRIYLIRDNKMIQLSEDHSLVYEHVKAGLITAEQARESYFRNIITRSIGTESSIIVDSFHIEIEKDDIFMLCSDGLNTMVQDEEIFQIITGTHLNDVPEALVNTANEEGGEDNVTAVVVHVGDDPTIKKAGKKRKKPKKKSTATRRDI